MAKTKEEVMLAVASKAKRKAERSKVGRLGDEKIANRTLTRYSVAMERLLCWIEALYSDIPDDAEEMDELLCEWGEY